MRSLIDTRSWLTALFTLGDLAAAIRSRLKQLQYRPGLLDAFLAHTGLIANPGST
ncbi:hypothetical protein [Nonomuraea sp. NPDC050783]|uniref:hypothetical protein n=1 Tax=Nonomuraea sp. NPDC050783 TaxID=3154634 RepID=UPI0034666BA4